MPETLELERRVRTVEEELRTSSSAAASHFVELREFFQDGQRSLARQMQELSARISEQFGKIERQFQRIDRKFEQIDRKFEQIDRKFEQIDRRFEQIDRRFEQIDRRFEQIDQRLDRLEAKLDLFIKTQGAINRDFERRLRRLEKRYPAPAGRRRKPRSRHP
jgi:chromosome segregation ATPase